MAANFGHSLVSLALSSSSSVRVCARSSTAVIMSGMSLFINMALGLINQNMGILSLQGIDVACNYK